MLAFLEMFIKIGLLINMLERKKLKSRPGVLELQSSEITESQSFLVRNTQKNIKISTSTIL